VEGSGSVVLLAGGGPGVGHSHYHPWFSRLAGSHAVVYIDWPGTGRSEPAAEYTIEHYARCLDDVRRALGAGTVAVIGLSFGGMPALRYALEHPCRALVLSNAQTGGPSWQEGNIDNVNAALREQFPERWRRLLELRAAGVRSLDYQELYDGLIERLEWADPANRPRLRHDEHNGLRLDVYGAFAGDDPEWRVGGAIGTFDPDLSRVRVPALVVTGRWDRLTSPRLALATADALPDARLEILDASAHRPWAEEPDRYFELLGSFLA
jgi:proline iminopeptidase